MNHSNANVRIALVTDLEIELLLATLPFRRPSDFLDARVALRTQYEQVNA
ncbi:MAG: hypothetical protein K8R92_03520 [Planctomycetes bacterium]|nr:hypothetical protein [Planctomycetota bacterium]